MFIAYEAPQDPTDRRGPLAGKRLAVKDNLDVAGFETTAACPAFAYAPRDSAAVVAKLQDITHFGGWRAFPASIGRA